MSKIALICIACEKEFFVWPSAIKHHFSKYCSLKCSVSNRIPWNKGKRRSHICVACKIDYTPPRARKNQKFCSRLCYQSWEKGKNNPMYGKQVSKLTRGKRSIASKGQKRSDETRLKMKLYRQSVEGREQNRKAGIASRIKQFQHLGPTSIETKLYQELKDRGLLFEKQKLINGKFLVDAYIPSLNLIIEADGNYWHAQERAIIRDAQENKYLPKAGFRLLRLTETEINNGSFKEKLPS